MKLNLVRLIPSLLVLLVLGANSAQANPTVSVTYNPQSLKIYHPATFFKQPSDRFVNVNVVRSDPDTFCNRVAYFRVNLNTGKFVSQTVGRCNFNETVQIELLSADAVKAACTPSLAGQTLSSNYSAEVRLFYNNGNTQSISKSALQAQVQCPCTPVKMDLIQPLAAVRLRLGVNNHEPLFRASGHFPLVKSVSGAMPPGLSLDLDAAGVAYVNGQPAVEGDYKIDVRITDSCPYSAHSTEQRTYGLYARCNKLEFPPNMQLPESNPGKNYDYQLTTSCNPQLTPQYFYAEGLPPGLKLSSSGKLFGFPTRFGQYSVTLNVMDGQGNKGKAIVPMKVVAQLPPQLNSFKVVPSSMYSQGGYAVIYVSAADSTGIKTVDVIVLMPDGKQTSVPAKADAWTGTWEAVYNIPANMGRGPQNYGFKAVVTSEGLRSTTSQTASVVVQPLIQKAPVSPPQVQGTQRQSLPTQSVPKTQPNLPTSIR